MSDKVALITGITGQDGAYLAEYLLKMGYMVHGIKRRASSFNTDRIDHLYEDPHKEGRRLILHYGDMTDSLNITRIIKEVQPDEIYNLAAMSHVKVSFDTPEYTANADALGTLRILEAVRLLDLTKKTRIYQASTSELYGLVQEVNYREAYGIHANNGILFNHESPLRGETFVTRKITRAVSRIVLGHESCLYLGNLSSKRDWGHAKDYVRAMHAILQQPDPSDYVIATGITTTVRDFVRMAFAEVGVGICFEGEGIHEKAFVETVEKNRFIDMVGEEYLPIVNSLKGKIIVAVDPAYFRPTEVDLLIGDPTKSKTILGWEPEYDLPALIADMVSNDIKLTKKETYLRDGGYQTLNYYE